MTNITGFPISQFYSNKLFAEILQLLGLAVVDQEGGCDYVLTELGVEFFYANASASPREVMDALAAELKDFRESSPTAAMITRGQEILDDRYDMKIGAEDVTFRDIAEDLWCAMDDVRRKR